MTTPLIVELDARTTKLDASLTSSSNKLDAFEGKISKADDGLASMSSEALAATASLKKLNENSDKATDSITALSNKLVSQREATKKSSAEVSTLTSKLKTAKESTESTADEIDALEKSLEKAREEMNKNKTSTNSMSGELKKAKAEYQLIQSEIKSTESNLKSINSTSSAAGSSLFKSASTVAGGIVKVGTAAVAAATALSTMIVMAAKSQQELGILSKQAKLSTADFEALAFATTQYGVSAEQIADISKDISDKIGEYSKAGTGAFQDFADVVGLTTEEAIKAANEFSDMSSDQVLGKMVSMMEDSGATANQMTFALESMGNDASRLTELFANQSSELNTLTSRYSAATKSLNLTKGEAKDLQYTATSFNLVMSTMGKSGDAIAANLAPTLNEFFNSVISEVPTATQVIIDFMNSFKDAENIKSIEDVNAQILDAQVRVSELRQEQTSLNKVVGDYGIVGDSARIKTAQNSAEVKELEERITSLIEQKEKLAAQEVEDAKRYESTGISTSTGSGVISTADDTAEQISAIEDRFKTEEQLLAEKLDREIALIGEKNELKLKLEEEFVENMLALDQEREDELLERQEDIKSQLEKDAKANIKASEKESEEKEAAQQNYLNAATTIGNALFEDNKAVNAGLAVANTAAGVTKALSTQNWAAAAATAVAGAAQLSTILGASKGSSTTTSVDSTSGSTDTSSTSISSVDSSGTTQNVVVSFDASDSDIIAAIAKGLKTESTTGNI